VISVLNFNFEELFESDVLKDKLEEREDLKFK